jgi:hypothetical protein
MSHQSLIDGALSRAKARMSSGVGSTDKIASVDDDTFIKEANETANALEYIALGMADDGSAAGAARSSMVSDYLKTAAAPGPSAGATTTTGTQSQVPSGSKKKLLMTPAGKVNPDNSEALEGKQPENIFRTMPPATKAAPKDGAGKKTANMSLYDVLMNNKEAAGGGPIEMDSEQGLPGVPQGGDGEGFASSLLGSNSAPVSATKREAKAPTRPRLDEAWDHANDTTGAASGKAVWPQATSKGSLKIAELVRAFRDEREKEAAAPEGKEDRFAGAKRVGKGMAGLGALGAAAGGAAGAGIGHAVQKTYKDKAKNREFMQSMMGAARDAGAGKKDTAAFMGGVAKGRKTVLRHGKKLYGGMGAAGLGAAGLGAGALAGGAYHMYKKRQAGQQQSKSAEAISDYAELFELALSGDLGDEYQAWASKIEAA